MASKRATKRVAKSKPSAKQSDMSKTNPESITVTYDLFDLPTAQHKAGLAGLLLQIRHMEQKRPKPAAIPRIAKITATSVTIEFTEESVQCLFDDAYAAERVEVKVKSKWAGATETRAPAEEVLEVDGKPKKVKYYFYEAVQPTGAALEQYITRTPEAWLKLWRDMLWNIPRGNPQSRQPFEQRADGKPCKEGANTWSDLLKSQKALQKNSFHTSEVAGSLWLGAQASNAENIPFEGRVEQTLLLHFWPIAAFVFTPQLAQPDGTSDFVGYVLAIPEVADLPLFVADFPRVLGELGSDMRGYRPAEAVIDLPAEGALSFLEHLARLSASLAGQGAIKYSISSVEYLHLIKIGNNIKTMASGRVAPRMYLVDRYRSIVGRVGDKPPYSNPLFRRGLLLALLDDRPWFQPFDELFAEWSHSFFVPSEDPPKLSWFWIDARSKLSQLEKENTELMKTEPEAVADDDRLAILVHRLARTYLAERAKQKSGVDPDKFKAGDKIAWDKVPKEYYDSRRDAGESLFLEFRSRRDQAFVDHFAQTFFAVKQYVSEDQYVEVSNALIHRPEDVKTLTLMALSANS